MAKKTSKSRTVYTRNDSIKLPVPKNDRTQKFSKLKKSVTKKS